MTVLRNLELNLVESPATMSHSGDSGGSDGFRLPDPGGLARVGADLRAARERLGWTPEAVAAHLRIRPAFLRAIEDGRMADLPGNAYAAGFARAYAQAVGLDAGEVARRFHAEAAQANRRTELDFPAPVPERGVPPLAVVAVGAVLAIGAYVGWYRLSGDERPSADVVQQVPDRLAPLAEPAQVKPADVAPEAKAMAPVAPPPVPPAPAPVAPAPAVHPDAARVVLRATADAWMRVRDKQTGQVLLNRVLKSGETWPVPARPLPLLLTDGNVSGTELLVDGVPAPPFGVEGRVLRDLPLDPEALKLGRVAANAPRPPPHNP